MIQIREYLHLLLMELALFHRCKRNENTGSSYLIEVVSHFTMKKHNPEE